MTGKGPGDLSSLALSSFQHGGCTVRVGCSLEGAGRSPRRTVVTFDPGVGQLHSQVPRPTSTHLYSCLWVCGGPWSLVCGTGGLEVRLAAQGPACSDGNRAQPSPHSANGRAGRVEQDTLSPCIFLPCPHSSLCWVQLSDRPWQGQAVVSLLEDSTGPSENTGFHPLRRESSICWFLPRCPSPWWPDRGLHTC